MDLEEAAEDLVHDAVFWAMAFEDDEYPVAELGPLALEAGAKFRALGIMGFLATADKANLYVNLQQSAKLRIQYLQKVKAENAQNDHHYVLGRLDPILDLLACKDFASLASLQSLSPRDFSQNREYLDDYCYSKILMTLGLNNKMVAAHDETQDPTLEELMATLSQLEDYVEEDLFSRAALCRALLENNPDDFNEAFHNFIDQTAFAIDEAKEKAFDTPVVIASRFISIEGLALLTVAQQQGFSVNQDFQLCPLTAQ